MEEKFLTEWIKLKKERTKQYNAKIPELKLEINYNHKEHDRSRLVWLYDKQISKNPINSKELNFKFKRDLYIIH